MSEASDGSVMVYVTSDNTLIIAGQDGVIAGRYIRFNKFSQVTSLDLSNLDTSKVTDMMDMFTGCSSLTILDLTSFDTSKVTNMNAMFSDCSKMQSIKVSSKWVISSGCNTNSMFAYCGVSSVTYV